MPAWRGLLCLLLCLCFGQTAIAAEIPALNQNLNNYSKSIAEARKFDSMLRGASRRGSKDPLLYQAYQARAALRTSPNDLKANETLCDAQFRTGFLAAAAKQCRDTLKINPNSAIAQTTIANLLWRQENKTAAAKQIITQVLVAQPNYTPARLLLAEIANAEGNSIVATNAIQNAVTSDASAPTLVALAKMQIDAGKKDAAKASLLQALQADANYAEALGLLAQLYGDGGDYARALDFAQKSAAADPKSTLAQFRLGSQFEGLQRYDEAVAAYRAAIRLDPNFAPAHRQAGLVLLAHGSPVDATAQLQEAQRLSPKDQTISNALQQAYLLLGNTQAAGKYAAQDQPINAAPIAAQPSRLSQQLAQALAAEQRQDYAAAQRIYEQVVIDSPSSPDGYYHLSRIFRAGGNAQQAYRFVELALARQGDYNPALALRSRMKCYDRQNVAAWQDYAKAKQAGYNDSQNELFQFLSQTCAKPAAGT